ncbi:redoxin domain-containing protein [bacterium]|nr:redoxin domain-containing protein [bacterium]
MSARGLRLGGALAASALVVFALWVGITKRSPSDPLPSALESERVPAAVMLPVLDPQQEETGDPAPFLAPMGENGGWPLVTVVNFWGSWCLACEVEMPELVLLSAEWEECAVRRGKAACPVMVGVAFYDTPANASAFLRRHGATYRNFLDNGGKAIVEWGIYGAPETFFVDSRGYVRHRHVGAISEEELREWVAKVAAMG